MNPADPRTGAHLLDALRSRAIALPDPSLRVDDATASLLGTGESYAAWLVTDGTASLVFRLARRRPEDMPCPMIDEFRAGSLIPDDIGSRPLAMDDLADNPLGTPYIVATYAPGSLRVPSAWDAGLLGSLAGRLAVLHERTYPLAGSVGGAAERLDIVREFDDSYAWWQAADPEIASGPEAAALALRIRPHIVAAAPAFNGISYSLIHGDLVATNILIDERGTPRLIDWEWARIGDVANDLALIGGRITGGPWYVPMDEATIDRLLAEYLAARTAQTGLAAEPLARLRARRDSWELLERFFTSLHCEGKALRSGDPLYAQATRQMRAGLHALV